MSQTILPGMEMYFSPPPLSAGARRCWEVLSGYARTAGQVFPFQETIARVLGVSVRSVQRWVGELRRYGLVQVQKRGRTSALYAIDSGARAGGSFGGSNAPPSITDSTESKTTEEFCSASEPICDFRSEEGDSVAQRVENVAAAVGVAMQTAVDTLRSLKQRLARQLRRAVHPTAYLLKCLRTELEMQRLTDGQNPVPDVDLEAILDECEDLYSQAGRPIPAKHRRMAAQLLISSEPNPAHWRRLPNYIRWALGMGLWREPSTTKGLLNLLRDGDWNVDLVQRTLPAAPQQQQRPATANDIAAQRFLEKRRG